MIILLRKTSHALTHSIHRSTDIAQTIHPTHHTNIIPPHTLMTTTNIGSGAHERGITDTPSLEVVYTIDAAVAATTKSIQCDDHPPPPRRRYICVKGADGVPGREGRPGKQGADGCCGPDTVGAVGLPGADARPGPRCNIRGERGERGCPGHDGKDNRCIRKLIKRISRRMETLRAILVDIGRGGSGGV